MTARTSPQTDDSKHTRPRPLLITGMHRSGTSLVAQAFAAAGVFMGRDLLPPSENNRRGYIEPVSIIRFHDTLLAHYDTAWWDVDGLTSNSPQPSPQSVDAARSLIADEFAGIQSWGFKDPRTCLFLDLWNLVLPKARYVFVARDPASVAFSLLRRGDPLGTKDPDPTRRARIALQLWRNYNERLLTFRNRHPAVPTTVLFLDEALRGDGPHRARLHKDLGIDLTDVFDHNLLCRAVPAWLHELASDEKVCDLHDQLRNSSVV